MPGNVRPLIRVLEAVGLDAPANVVRSQEQLFINYQIQDLERLSEPTRHTHVATRNTSPIPGGGSRHAAFRIIPGPRGLRITFVQNLDPVGNPVVFGVQQELIGTFATSVTPQTIWGGEMAATIEQGFVIIFTVQLAFFLPNFTDKQTELDSPIPVYPGEVFYYRTDALNVATTIAVAFDEPL